MVRTTWAIATMLVVALIAVAVVVITESTTSAACQDCSTTPAAYCNGAPSGVSSCQVCFRSGACDGTSTFYSGKIAFGTTTPGSSYVDYSSYPCQMHMDCVPGNVVTPAACETWDPVLDLFGSLACRTDVGSCYPCAFGDIVVDTHVYSCT